MTEGLRDQPERSKTRGGAPPRCSHIWGASPALDGSLCQGAPQRDNYDSARVVSASEKHGAF
eukprot:13704739-Alexandrium_andersonii.AAC.1